MNATLDVIFLTAAGEGVGLGHLKRCMALAAALQELGATVGFAVAGDVERLAAAGLRPARTVALEWIEAPGLALEALARWRPEAVVVDSYAATPELLADLRSVGTYVTVIDDLADRPLPVDLVVNGAYHAAGLPYRGLPETVFLLGPRYVLLEPAFGDAPPRSPHRDARRVLISLGGEGGGKWLRDAVATVSRAVPRATIDVVLGPLGAALEPGVGRTRVHRGLQSLRALMLEADFAVTAAGMTLYECLASGTPVVAVCLADNQRPNFEALAEAGLILPGSPRLEAAVQRLAGDGALREGMGARGRQVVDGKGARRVAAQMAPVALSVEPPRVG